MVNEIMIPELYDTENVNLDDKIIYSCYRTPPENFHLVCELDQNTGLAFGYVTLSIMRDCAEWGYFNVDEILECGGQLCFDWKPCNLAEFKLLFKIK